MDLWSEVLTKLSEKISKPSFETWFAGTEAEIIGETLLIKPKNSFAADWLQERYHSLISETVNKISEKTYEIKIADVELQLENNYPAFSSPANSASYLDFKKIIEEQNEILLKQQRKIEELEKRVQALEKQRVLF